MVQPVALSKLQGTQPIVDSDGRPTPYFMRLINGNQGNVEYALNQILQIPDLQAAIDAANASAAAAAAAAAVAQAAADAASNANSMNAREQALVNSYIEPSKVLTATSIAIVIQNHTRYYGDGTNVAVTGDQIAPTGPNRVNYIYYVDPTRAGGAVTYIATETQPVQMNDVHVVGAITIPTTGTSTGGDGPRPPGTVQP